jgi:hypothetical protein
MLIPGRAIGPGFGFVDQRTLYLNWGRSLGLLLFREGSVASATGNRCIPWAMATVPTLRRANTVFVLFMAQSPAISFGS